MLHTRQNFPKRVFDVANKEDLTTYKYYITNYSWGPTGCPFELEWPWLTIPDMIAHKISEYTVNNI